MRRSFIPCGGRVLGPVGLARGSSADLSLSIGAVVGAIEWQCIASSRMSSTSFMAGSVQVWPLCASVKNG